MMAGIRVQHQSESAFTFDRNRRSGWAGIRNHEGMPVISTKSELLRWLDQQLTREHDRAVFDLPLAAAADGRLPIGPMGSSPRADAAVKDAAETRHREAARTRP
jgi:hypothetical protein